MRECSQWVNKIVSVARQFWGVAPERWFFKIIFAICLFFANGGGADVTAVASLAVAVVAGAVVNRFAHPSCVWRRNVSFFLGRFSFFLSLLCVSVCVVRESVSANCAAAITAPPPSVATSEGRLRFFLARTRGTAGRPRPATFTFAKCPPSSPSQCVESFYCTLSDSSRDSPFSAPLTGCRSPGPVPVCRRSAPLALSVGRLFFAGLSCVGRSGGGPGSSEHVWPSSRDPGATPVKEMPFAGPVGLRPLAARRLCLFPRSLLRTECSLVSSPYPFGSGRSASGSALGRSRWFPEGHPTYSLQCRASSFSHTFRLSGLRTTFFWSEPGPD